MNLGIKLLTSTDAIQKEILRCCTEALNSAISRALPSIKSRLSDLVADVVFPYGEDLANKLSQGITTDFKEVKVAGGGVSGTLTIGLIQSEGPGSTLEIFESLIADYRIEVDFSGKGKGKGASKSAFNLALNSVLQGDAEDNFITRAFSAPDVEQQVNQIISEEVLRNIR